MAAVVIPEVRLREERSMRGGDEAEFAEFTAREGGRLLGFAVLLTGDWQDAEDLVQMALLRSASHWPVARRRPEGYARAVLVNLARDRWRSRRRYHAEPFADDQAHQPPAAAGDVTAAVLDRTAGTVKSHTHRALARLRLALADVPELEVRPDKNEAPC